MTVGPVCRVLPIRRAIRPAAAVKMAPRIRAWCYPAAAAATCDARPASRSLVREAPAVGHGGNGLHLGVGRAELAVSILQPDLAEVLRGGRVQVAAEGKLDGPDGDEAIPDNPEPVS